MTADAFRPCVLIPTYDNPRTIRAVVQGARAHLSEVLVVDDGSAKAGRDEVLALEAEGLARRRRRAHNGGKGAAVQTGLRFARELGFTHALQVDADGQHDLTALPRLLEAARLRPEALVLAAPVFDDSAPRGRLIARKISQLWVNLETGGPVIRDPLCGLRVYPVEAAIAARPRARRMGHDPEIAVKLFWRGAPVVNIETKVRYLSAEEGGVSHYRLLWDNLEMSWVHTRLSSQAPLRLVLRRLGGQR